jgi:hypothetical protein
MSAESNSAPGADIPIFYNGYHIHRFSDHANQTLKGSYLVQAIYPAAEVLEFYDR